MTKNISGIYAIRNKTNGKLYVGSSKSIAHRWNQSHRPLLRINKHANRHIQHSWNKYGETNFELITLEECPEMILADREGYWIEHHKLWDRQHGYNLNRFVGGRTIASEETRQILKDRWTEIKSKDNYKIGFIEHKLTEDMKKDINELRACGLTRQEIFDQIGISRTQFYRAMEGDGQYGGNKKNRTSYKTMTPEIKRRAIELREQGRSWREIGEELGVDRVTFYKHKMVAGHRDMVRKSMTEEAKQEVLRLRREGKTWRAISEATGFSKNTFFNNKLHII